MQDVAIGVLISTEGKILIGKRRAGSRYEGVWEFPGGKIEAGETAEQALRRELAEELGIELVHTKHLLTLEYRYEDGGEFRLWYFLITAWHGQVQTTLWEYAAWVTLEELECYPIFDANRRIISHLGAYVP